MSKLVALSISIGVLGGIAAALFLGPLSGILLIWAVFISWACFFAIGGDETALKNTILSGIFGAIMAWIGLLIFLSIPLAEVLTLPIWAGLVVAFTVTIMCLIASFTIFSSIPAAVLGYASVAAFALQTTDALTIPALTSIGFDNAIIIIILSLIVGAILGMISGKMGSALTTE